MAGVITIVILLCWYQSARQTALAFVWWWALAAALCWGGFSTAYLMIDQSHWVTGWADQACYFSAILILCPFIAILGARRPVANVWSLFVVGPLILVLSWPLLVTWMNGSSQEPLQIQPPMLLGFVVVILMAIGNYFGTRFTLPVLMMGAAVILLVVPLTPAAPQFFPTKTAGRFWADGLLSLAAIFTVASWKLRASMQQQPLDRLWVGFRDCFGIVWAKRVLDRMNQVAVTKQWPVRLELHGFVWNKQVTPNESIKTRIDIEQNLRWILKRFVNQTWIDAYLSPTIDQNKLSNLDRL